MSEKRIKVTDRRMFTADGQLRDDYKEELADAPAPSAVAEPPPEPEAPQATPETTPEPEEEPLESGAGFHDLVGLLAQSASVYMTQASQRLEQRAEMIELARMHVDLLVILQRKTRGNLDPQEQALLDDAVYQLRMAFVQQG